jgi:hypothetical protein
MFGVRSGGAQDSRRPSSPSSGRPPTTHRRAPQQSHSRWRLPPQSVVGVTAESDRPLGYAGRRPPSRIRLAIDFLATTARCQGSRELHAGHLRGEYAREVDLTIRLSNNARGRSSVPGACIYLHCIALDVSHARVAAPERGIRRATRRVTQEDGERGSDREHKSRARLRRFATISAGIVRSSVVPEPLRPRRFFFSSSEGASSLGLAARGTMRSSRGRAAPRR